MPVVFVKTENGKIHRYASDSIAACDQIAAREAEKPGVIEVKINKKIVFKKD